MALNIEKFEDIGIKENLVYLKTSCEDVIDNLEKVLKHIKKLGRIAISHDLFPLSENYILITVVLRYELRMI